MSVENFYGQTLCGNWNENLKGSSSIVILHKKFELISLIIKKFLLIKFLNFFLDPRAQNWRWPFTESPPYGFMSLLLAFYFLIKFGPYVMKNRKPFRLKTVMIVYNAFQVIVNSAASIAVSKKMFLVKICEARSKIIL